MNPQITQISQNHQNARETEFVLFLILHLCNLRNLWIVLLSSNRQSSIVNRQWPNSW